MFLPLVIKELVKAIKCLVSLTVTIVERAGMLAGTMLFSMTVEVAGATEGCGTTWLVTHKAVGIDLSTDSSCVNASGWNRHLSQVCDTRLDDRACGAAQIRRISRD